MPTAASPAAIHVHCGRLNLQDADFARYWPLLAEHERERALRMKNPNGPLRYVETHGLLRLVLGRVADARPETLRIEQTSHGKPYLADYPAIAFNLSHTGDYLAIAWSRNCRLGIDIETNTPRKHLFSLADRVFADCEKKHWLSLPEAERLPAFYRYWTRKEAFAKAFGQGISLGLEHCVIDPVTLERMLSVPAACGMASGWSLRGIEIADGVVGAIAADCPIDTINIHSLDTI